jgi:hypothetical protein
MAAGDPTPGSLQPGQLFVNFSTGRTFIGAPTSLFPDGFTLVSDHKGQDAAIAERATTAYVDAQVATRAAAGHTHAIADIPGLQAALGASGASGFVPGMIMMWSGAIAQIPAGWALCDGALGRPDLRDRFIIGAGQNYSVGSTGGAHTKTLVTETAGAHSHGGYTLDHVLTKDQLPKHNHNLTDPGHLHSIDDPGHTHRVNVGNGDTAPVTNRLDYYSNLVGSTSQPVLEAKTGIKIVNNTTGITIDNVGDDAGHKHGISSTGTEHSHPITVNVQPAYYALAFIIKITEDD